MIVVGVVLLVAGATAGYLGAAGKCGPTGAGGGDKGYQAGYEAARKKVAETHMFPQPASMMNISGTVVSVSDNKLVMDTPQVILNPLEPQAPTQRTVNVSSDTEIKSQVMKDEAQQQKDRAQFEAEMTKFNEALKSGKTPPAPPMPPNAFEEKKIKISEIKTGAQIMVSSASDILLAETIDATAISVSSSGLGGPGTVIPPGMTPPPASPIIPIAPTGPGAAAPIPPVPAP